jgi:hypothetical protein
MSRFPPFVGHPQAEERKEHTRSWTLRREAFVPKILEWGRGYERGEGMREISRIGLKNLVVEHSLLYQKLIY